MKRALITVTCAMGFLFNATSARALTLSVADAYYLGFIDPATPASAAAELFYVNYLANLDIGEVETGVTTPNNPHVYTFSREDSTLAGSFPTAVLTGNERGAVTTISDVSGFFFALAKYGTVAHVWVLNQVSGGIQLPSTAPGGGLSQTTLFQTENGGGGGSGGGTVTVPDGGATIGLLGLAMLALGFFRHHLT